MNRQPTIPPAIRRANFAQFQELMKRRHTDCNGCVGFALFLYWRQVMRARAVTTMFMGLVLCALALQAGSATAQKDGKKKFEIPKDAIEGTVKSVDMTKDTFTITLKAKKDRTFTVDK